MILTIKKFIECYLQYTEKSHFWRLRNCMDIVYPDSLPMIVLQNLRRVLDKLPRLNSTALLLLKWLSLGVIALAVISLGEVQDIWHNLLTFPAGALLLFGVSGVVSRVFYTLRWGQINRGMDMRTTGFAYLYRVGLLSEFVSIVLPSYLGGDGVRLLKMRERGENNRQGIFSIFLDRIIGMVTLMLLTVLFIPFVLPLLQIDFTIPPLVVIAMLVAALLILAAGFILLRRRQVRLPAMLQGLRVTPLSLIVSSIHSLLGHFVFAAGYYVLFRELAPVDFAPLIAIVLLALLTRTIPLSVFGIDISDGSILVLAGWLGVPADASLSVVALLIISRYAFSAAGLLIELVADGRQVFRRPSASETG